jgi:hypothetical protein
MRKTAKSFGTVGQDLNMKLHKYNPIGGDIWIENLFHVVHPGHIETSVNSLVRSR